MSHKWIHECTVLGSRACVSYQACLLRYLLVVSNWGQLIIFGGQLPELLKHRSNICCGQSMYKNMGSVFVFLAGLTWVQGAQKIWSLLFHSLPASCSCSSCHNWQSSSSHSCRWQQQKVQLWSSSSSRTHRPAQLLQCHQQMQQQKLASAQEQTLQQARTAAAAAVVAAAAVQLFSPLLVLRQWSPRGVSMCQSRVGGLAQ